MKYYILLETVFGNIKYTDVERYKTINRSTDSKWHCKTCGKKVGLLEWLPPYILKACKKRLADFLYGPEVTPFIVSENVKTKYEASGLVGLSNFQRVELYYRGQPVETPYYFPYITCETYPVDLQHFIPLNELKENFSVQDLCPACQRLGSNAWAKKINKIVFLDPEKIDQDIFLLPIEYAIIVSERFKEFVESNGFTNFKVFETSKYQWHQFNHVLYENGRAFYDPARPLHPHYRELDDLLIED
jgi:hypothetical protein